MSGDPDYTQLLMPAGTAMYNQPSSIVDCCNVQSFYNKFCVKCGRANNSYALPLTKTESCAGRLLLRRQSAKLSCARCFEPAERSSDSFCGHCGGVVHSRGLIEHFKNGF